MLGLSIWLRPNAIFIGPFFMLALSLFARRRCKAVRHTGIMTLTSFIVVAPITVRNYIIYRQFVPITDHLGAVLWEGIGEAGGARFGAVATDAEIGPQEAVLYGDSRYAYSWSTPDGIRRDHDRIRKSLGIIVRNPGWHLHTVVRRMERMLRCARSGPLIKRKYTPGDHWPMASESSQEIAAQTAPSPFAESTSWMRPAVKRIQRILKESVVPSIVIGGVIIFMTSRRRASLIMMVPLYYLLLQSSMHTEARYTVAMQYFLFILVSTFWVLLGVAALNLAKRIASRAATT